MSSPVFGDCPACGQSINLSAVQPESLIRCPACGVENYADCCLNLRTTPQRVEPRGWLGRLIHGSGIQKSQMERQAEDRRNLERNIHSCRGLITLAQMEGNFQKATFYQNRLEQLLQQLDDLDDDDLDDDE